jgi:hypothetical protein
VVDHLAGLEAPSVTRALADEFAGRVIDEGLVKPGGRASLSPAERLLAGIERIGSGGRARQRGAGGDGLDAVIATHDTAPSVRESKALADGVARFTGPQLAKLQEIMGVLLGPTGDPQKFVTHFGLDPIWGSAPLDAGPYIHQFPLRVAVGTGISLLEAP